MSVKRSAEPRLTSDDRRVLNWREGLIASGMVIGATSIALAGIAYFYPEPLPLQKRIGNRIEDQCDWAGRVLFDRQPKTSIMPAYTSQRFDKVWRGLHSLPPRPTTCVGEAAQSSWSWVKSWGPKR